MDLALPADTPSPAHARNRFHTYVQIAMILAIITGVELLLIFLSPRKIWWSLSLRPENPSPSFS